ncbi:conserved hypothetical protein [Deferribacter desulfuricans SSM1]|uniref:DUF2155 domain-containing protein n=1 Tax=Deferribacter desulfuricans (strain DSM 14783 / JCM 11476 / NBRC 101012 / SSM1) TaxID=639282 RepID=D3P8U8_DEFDS|nr:DUF2155 domain-containing protein [Deferribacter desulfuricans]BAI81138.1 conserved hypothetical protein [Deferribacter desulfuricans SSM1]
MFKYIILFLSFIVFIACSQNTIKEESTNTSNKETVTKQELATKENPHENIEKKVERKIVVPDEVAKLYKSVIITVKDNVEKKDLDTEIIIGQTSEVSGTPLAIQVEAFLPDFVMDETGVMTSKSKDENNPAVKVKIYKNKELVFDGWVFGKFPTMHAFTDDRYSVVYKGAVKK